MRVYLGSDHAGFELKAHLLKYLMAKGYEVVDVGPHEYDPDDDYPAYCLATGEHTVNDPGGLGVVIGGSGNGEQIAANKARAGGVPGARRGADADLGRATTDQATQPPLGLPVLHGRLRLGVVDRAGQRRQVGR